MQEITYQYIKTNQELAEICQTARQKPVVALDTEFVRIRTFYPQLGLIQLFDGQQVSLIDPLDIDDFSPFVSLLADKQVLKVLHACGEDLEVFQHQFKQLPEPMLDTQVMAGFLNIGTSMGFAKLVQHFLGLELDKGASRTDWLARPLTQTQLQYAAADVFYLLPAYHKLAELFDLSPWQEAIVQECNKLLDKCRQTTDPAKLYQDISNAWQLTPQQLAVLQVLAKWRYEEAKKRNLALNFVVKEQSLLQIAKDQPIHTTKLLDFMHPNEVRIHGKKLLWLVEQGQAIDEANYPPAIVRLVDQPGYKASLKALQQKLDQIKPLDLPLELVASKRQLNQLFSWHQKGRPQEKLPELLTGWREAMGRELLGVL
ncbi:ribonuclease D [Pasteurellaceae bacterium RH1A]|nr:ribonuclease D [Pasteurellaceae bacterium RH1A]